MRVEVQLHLEAVPDEGFVWWAESPDVSGFSAAASHLPELLERCDSALSEILDDSLEIAYRMVSLDSLPRGADLEPARSGDSATSFPSAPAQDVQSVSAVLATTSAP